MPRPLLLRRNERGFTLVEAMVVVAIAGILIGFGYSGFTGMLARYRCQGAMNRIAQTLKLAQMKAIEQSVDYFVNFGGAGNDTLAITFDNDDNNATAAVVFEQIDLAQEYKGVNVVPSSCNGIHFDVRGVPKTATGARGNCTVRLSPTSNPAEQGNVTISWMGRIQVAIPEQWKY